MKIAHIFWEDISGGSGHTMVRAQSQHDAREWFKKKFGKNFKVCRVSWSY